MLLRKGKRSGTSGRLSGTQQYRDNEKIYNDYQHGGLLAAAGIGAFGGKEGGKEISIMALRFASMVISLIPTTHSQRRIYKMVATRLQ